MNVIITSLSAVTVDGGPSMDLVSHAANAGGSDERSALHLAALEYEAAFLGTAAKATAILDKVEQALQAGDLDTVKQLLQPAVDEAKQTERERRITELTKARDEAQRVLDEASRAEVEAVVTR